ncbi:MAG: hypothetical protein JRE40_12140 [Deltaproteobacteria bacterium]|nr:hypothetical protein [Deltaproteobacteria bacterium]
MEVKIGCLEPFEDDWFEGLRALAREKIAEALNVPIEQVADENNLCGDDESFHFRVGDRVFHLCYSDPRDIFVVEEVRCPICGQWLPANVLEEHREICEVRADE